MILICAATATEAKACQTGLTLAKNGHSFEVLQTGMGRDAARRSLQAYLRDHDHPSLIISSGFAGSLRASAAVGSWVGGTALRDGFAQTDVTCTPIPRAVISVLGDSLELGRIRAVDAVVTEHTSEKNSDDEAVDMESFGLLEIARANQIAFSILRLVSDTPKEPLPEAIKTFSAMLLSEGSRAKGHALFQGTSQLIRSPKSFTLFALKASRLRDDLTQGWKKIADAWPMRPGGS